MPSVMVGPEVDPLVGREVGGYVIESSLGEGGMGLVYQARHPFLGRRFAIKVLRPELASDRLLSSNFVREAQTLSGLKHPHIIDIVGFGPLDAHREYMVMEFLDGITLEAELAKQGTLSVLRVLGLADQILDGLEAAHSIDVIHRDLKPSNVFLARVSGGGQVVKLLDFGLAKLQPQAIAGAELAPSALSTIAGTPDYIAPEQARGRGISKLSDLYSFGAMLFELLTGAKLFAAAPGATDPIRELITHHLVTRAPELGDDFPEDLGRLVSELLEKDPALRPQSAQQVRQRLRKLGRELQREETRQAPNPLLAVSDGSESEPRIDAPLLAQPPRSLLLPILVGAVVVLLGAVLLLGSKPEAAPVVPAVSPVVPAVSAVPSPAPVVAEQPTLPAPMPEPVVEDLEPLPNMLAKPRARGRKVEVIAPKEGAEAAASCDPDDRWRAAARAHLQELQQLAASDATRFAHFEAVEGSITSAIGAAESSANCAAVDRQIQKLAQEMTR